ncbi:AMP-binding protein [Ornithinibacillus contaminans]|uniref:AMP-binding protein n=1 Tax=Ornithinibacillus contaminans TaxID=694055 RepID=UPI00064DD8AE|nr:AMP-binding protein [Ornithinibacillus contaminans]
MYLWENLQKENTAIITQTNSKTYTNFFQDVEAAQEVLRNDETDKQLITLLCKNNYEIVVMYIAALRSGHAVMLLNEDIENSLLEKIIKEYQPKWIFGDTEIKGYKLEQEKLRARIDNVNYKIHPDLAVLLSTSGTTGSQKFVRLSYSNIQSNAQSIIEYLDITQEDRGILNLPLSYSYGFSILNSHLLVGATVLLTDESVMERSFWKFVREYKATSLSGVPYTYQMLRRVGFLNMDLPDLTTLTQAGGHLDEALVKIFGEYALQNDKRFFVMYGQTEASPRMAYVPSEAILEKPSSIGIPIPGGNFKIESETSELIYTGQNVMMGYAESKEDLEKEDECHGLLYTGDKAKVDQDGYYYITGRMKRFVKLFGLRINLDDIERKLESITRQAVACIGNDDRLLVAVETEDTVSDIKECLEKNYKLHKSAYKIYVVESIPRLANGKTDYRSIKDVIQ